ncbi:MAG TPA: M23 family metallopeptidase [Microbacteriaceae bacterium]|nr:M23 family metallopeptidase [Microbacteriaceae bacterium]
MALVAAPGGALAEPRAATPHTLVTAAPAVSQAPGQTPASAEPEPGAGAWQWPLPTRHVLRGFEAPATRYGAGHRGIDLPAAPGARVVAPAGGVVLFDGPVAGRGVITIEVSLGLLLSMEPVTGGPVAGEVVSAGAPVGDIGSGGHCAGCLHLGVRLDGEYVSPLNYLAGVPRAVLLPLH